MDKKTSKFKVVAVDDEPDFLAVLRRMLTPRYDVECFTSGEDLPERLDALRPDLLILDAHMPGRSGVSLCRQIRAESRFRSLPILFLTSSKEDVDFFDAMKAGGDGYLNKPVGQAQLHTRLREILVLPAEADSWVQRS